MSWCVWPIHSLSLCSGLWGCPLVQWTGFIRFNIFLPTNFRVELRDKFWYERKLPQGGYVGCCWLVVLRNNVNLAIYHWIFTEITYLGAWNKFLEHVSTFTFNVSLFTQLVLQTCSKCPYTLFLWKFNDSSRCIGNERYICTTICKHTMNSGLCEIFRKFWGNSG